MAYVPKLRLSSFFMGAGAASFLGLSILHKDFKVAQEAVSEQVKVISNSLDQQILALEKLKKN